MPNTSVYRAHIWDATDKMYLEAQRGEEFTLTGNFDDRLCFFNEEDAETTLELMNEVLPGCYVLIAENPQIVYVVIMEWTCEDESDTEVEVFDDLDLAEGCFDRLVEREQKNTWIGELENVTEFVEQHSYHAYEDGNEAVRHTYIRIVEKEVNKEA